MQCKGNWANLCITKYLAASSSQLYLTPMIDTIPTTQPPDLSFYQHTWLEMGQTSTGISLFRDKFLAIGCLVRASPWPIRLVFSIRASSTLLSTEVPCQSEQRYARFTAVLQGNASSQTVRCFLNACFGCKMRGLLMLWVSTLHFQWNGNSNLPMAHGTAQHQESHSSHLAVNVHSISLTPKLIVLVSAHSRGR